jgi:hypothetical protein
MAKQAKLGTLELDDFKGIVQRLTGQRLRESTLRQAAEP